MMAKECFQKLIKDYKFHTVLDIGCGGCVHGNEFVKHNKHVVGVDLRDKHPNCSFDYHKSMFSDFVAKSENVKAFDCVWASHVLEHQLNVNEFLKDVKVVLKVGGVLAITVPPMKPNIVGGHVTLWNAGLLLYNVALAGFDLSDAIVKTYGYNISLITEYKPATLPRDLTFGVGDIEKLAHLLPKGRSFNQGFDGNINNIGWN